MTLGLWGLLLVAVRIGVAIHLARTIFWRRYRTLVPSLLIPAGVDAMWLLTKDADKDFHYRAWLIAQVVILPLWCAVVVEVAKISCEPLTHRQKLHSVGVMALAAGLGLEVTIRKVNLSPAESFFVGRQFILLAMLCALAALWLWRRR